jgi:hypothetical protein
MSRDTFPTGRRLLEKYKDKRKGDDGKTVYFINSTSCCGHYMEWLRGESPDRCPFCGCKYYDKPNLEMKLFVLQDEWLEEYGKNKSTAILGEKMFPLIQEYAVNMIKGMIKGKRSLAEDKLQERSFDAATLLVEVILRDPDHRMRYSFGDYLGRLCKSVCYSTKNHEKTFSLNSMLRDGETEFGETIVANAYELSGGIEEAQDLRFDNRIEMREVQEDTVEKIVGIIERSSRILFDNTGSYEHTLLYLQGLLMKLENGSSKLLSGFFEVSGSAVKSYVEKGELIIFDSLRETADR